MSQNIKSNNKQEIAENINIFETIVIKAYLPNNYLFVNEFEKELIKLIKKTAGFTFYENEKRKYTKNYLIHLRNIFFRVNNFIDDFYYVETTYFEKKDNIIEKKEENLNIFLNLLKKYLNTDQDKDKKQELNLILFEKLINLLELKYKILNIEVSKKTNNRILKRIKLIYKIIFYLLKNLSENHLLEIQVLNIILNLIEKFNKIKTIPNNISNLFRKIILFISEKIESYKEVKIISEIVKKIFNFVKIDLSKLGSINDYIIEINIYTLSNLSKHNLETDFISEKNLWKLLKNEYMKSSITNKRRLHLTIIFKNSIDYIIKEDLRFIQIIIKKIIEENISPLDNDWKIIGENEIELIYNIIKNTNHTKTFEQINIINYNDLKKIEIIYDKLDKKICQPLKSL